MKKQLKSILSFVSGALAMLLVVTLVIPALAESTTDTTNQTASSISIATNTINLKVNDKMVASTGEGYTNSAGKIMPISINYNGSTFLSLRHIGELLGLDVDYDADTNTAIITQKSSSSTDSSKTTDKTTTSPSTSGSGTDSSVTSTPSTDNTILFEGNLTYDKFNQLWDQPKKMTSSDISTIYYSFFLKDSIDTTNATKLLNTISQDDLKQIVLQFITNTNINNDTTIIRFYPHKTEATYGFFEIYISKNNIEFTDQLT